MRALSHRITLAIRDGVDTVPALLQKFPGVDRAALYGAIGYAREKGWIGSLTAGRYVFRKEPAERKTTSPSKPQRRERKVTSHLEGVWR